jgi:hypothetical protein
VDANPIGSGCPESETLDTGSQTRLHTGLQYLTELIDKRWRELQVELDMGTPEVSIEIEDFHEPAPDH